MTVDKPPSRGQLKVYLGYAAGVGKTFQMLADAHELKQKGFDIVIGYLEPHGRKDTIAKAEGLELIPRRRVEYRGSTFEEMDLDAILKRCPQVCVVDELAHTNVPGSRHGKRWEDVLVLLDSGMDVLTTMNIQHLESLNDQVWQMTGVRVRETIPDWVMKQADEVVMVDLTPRALLNRLERGVVYPPEKAQRALENFFKESTLVALRELALRQTAHEVEVRQVVIPEIDASPDDVPRFPPAGRVGSDRILVHLTEHPSTAMLIRRGRRVADYLQAECFAVYVHTEPNYASLPAARREAIERHLTFARNLHLETHILEGTDTVDTLMNFARLHRVTQIFLARPQYSRWHGLLAMNFVHRIVAEAREIQVTVVAERRREQRA
ncbi:MAG TPA: histidine kinase [Terriglobia bacterium]|jgi:two-component system sensor histidine kinase KdpD|nr:histidine kinase [Terriglobia bacterium]